MYEGSSSSNYELEISIFPKMFTFSFKVDTLKLQTSLCCGQIGLRLRDLQNDLI